MKRKALLLALVASAVSAPVCAQQHDHHTMDDMPGMDMGDMQMDPSSAFLLSESSGTAIQPSAWNMPMLMNETGNWHLMWMGQAFLVDTQQTGPRGGDKLYSTNWGMLSAVHRLGSGSIMLRSMLSLEPATVTDRRYPLLFQVGETAYGRPIVDAQHPHDLFMDLDVQYARTLSEHLIWNVDYAPVGDPALGPVAYPHRASASELPQATLGHHWQDSTHIANNVITSGLSYKKMRLEASGFYGREPDENRWNIDFGPTNSWSTRFSVLPTANWMAQVSIGRLDHPEATESGNQVRTTASVEYIRPVAHGNSWATTAIWGQDYNTAQRTRSNSVTAETLIPLGRLNFLTGRYEWSQRSELLPDQLAVPQVQAFTAGYTRDIPVFADLETGLGTNITGYILDDSLQTAYGGHPWAVSMYLRVRLKSSAKH